MKKLELVRALARRRAFVVVGVFAMVALSTGAGVVLAGASGGGITVRVAGPLPRSPVTVKAATGDGQKVIVGQSYHHDTSRPLRSLPPQPLVPGREFETSPNPRPNSKHRDVIDRARQAGEFAANMPATTLSFNGIGSPGVSCNCYPPDTNGEVGATQYVEMVNEGFQVFDKGTGASLLGPLGITTLWKGFGGACEIAGDGDPVVLYDQLANRWVITQFAGSAVPTDECIAVSTTSDATGTWNRYAFHLGSDFFDYPHLGVWPDAYYMSMNVFNSSGTAYLGPQPFAFDRAAMLAGAPATFVTTRNTAVFNSANDAMLPADLDGSNLAASGAPEPFLMSGQAATWKLWRYHVDFATPANSTFTLGGNLTPAGYTELCPTTRNCVPQPGTTVRLDGIGDRGMFRLAYRKFGDGHEALVGNQSVSSNGIAGIRWYEIANATSGAPGFVQQSTYQPDTTWRWLGSAAMDGSGNLAVGFSASSTTTFPSIRYAGRLAGDPANTLAQGEATIIAGGGSQTGSANRWGDYSDLTVDPVDDCTFWYTTEYYTATASVNWKTRIANFRFPSCGSTPPPPPPPPPPPTSWTLTVTKSGRGNGTVTSSPAGINCGGTCSASYANGTTVTLTTTAGTKTRFTGWSGDCSGTGSCVLSMTANHFVTATFAKGPRTAAARSDGLTVVPGTRLSLIAGKARIR
jgi:hypothetical protein